MNRTTVGLLPLYLELYDQLFPDFHKNVAAFATTIGKELEKSGVEVIAAPVCRVSGEFKKAVKSFEDKRVTAIVTLHLAYSPSLESADALASTKIPLIILDTTPDFDFGFDTREARIMQNHGIHGVQDLCNMLLRKSKPFMIEAGHWQKSDVMKRVSTDIKACVAASAMKNARVGIIGNPFHGMGDFAIPFADLKKQIGMEVFQASASKFSSMRLKPSETAEEIASYRKQFKVCGASDTCLERTAATSLKVRKWISKEKLSAFTFNFLDIDSKCGLGTVPFLEASMAMSHGTGFAGEGDVLTSAFTASLSKIFPETTFAEMFCPDWKGNRIFMSHMGELNVDLIDGKADLREKSFPFIKTESTAMACGCMKPGKCALVNLAPGPNGSFSIVASFGRIRSPRKTKFSGISGWFEPELPIDQMLTEYSLHGGTHHLALVYDPEPETIAKFAKIMGWGCVFI